MGKEGSAHRIRIPDHDSEKAIIEGEGSCYLIFILLITGLFLSVDNFLKKNVKIYKHS